MRTKKAGNDGKNGRFGAGRGANLIAGRIAGRFAKPERRITRQTHPIQGRRIVGQRTKRSEFAEKRSSILAIERIVPK